MLGVEALQGLGVVLRGRAPDGECTLWVLHNDDALCLHVDHGLERIWQLPVPLADLRPDGVAAAGPESSLPPGSCSSGA